ncbi:MAG: peptide chain release factor N(5)-glutamine methyltransferase [Desulfobulbaceae bacterium]|nr:peptide chain release factor N(5)-glutamine methyltransferase [Desulfobulbaceae bacterium]
MGFVRRKPHKQFVKIRDKMRFRDLIQEAAYLLVEAGVEGGRLEAELLAEHCFGLSRTELFLNAEKDISLPDYDRFNVLLKRRLRREPLHYITGVREFWSLDFTITPDTLIPRPETEFLLDHVLAILRESNFVPSDILDMCTGSGVIAIVLARELGVPVLGVDISLPALKTAAGNISKHGVRDSVTLCCSDLFSSLGDEARFDCIVANPPYVSLHAKCSLEPEVKDWEPAKALFAGPDGLDVINRICADSPRFLRSGGWVFLEIGADQQQRVEALFSGYVVGTKRVYQHVAVIPDLSGRPRVLQAQFIG